MVDGSTGLLRDLEAHVGCRREFVVPGETPTSAALSSPERSSVAPSAGRWRSDARGWSQGRICYRT